MAKLALAPQTKVQSLINILLVEDNDSDAFLVDSLLNQSLQTEYRLHRVQNQVQALAAIGENNFDICLLDLTLPDANGFSALIDIQEKMPDLPVVILTGVRDKALAKRAVRRGAQDYLPKDDLQADLLSRAIDYAVARKHVEKNLFQRANYDALTHLANRTMFLNRLSRALARSERTGAGIAILFIDLDRFKPINDTLGHDAGDETLKVIGQRIKSTLRLYDTPARLGGDEFAVLLEGITSARNAAAIALKILRALSAPIPYFGKHIEIGASIGIAFTDEPITPEILLQYADIAMYQTKKEGGGSYRFYIPQMYDEANSHLHLEQDLRTALSADELQLYYQPYVDPDGKAVLGVEALLRWKHPERGILCAHEFLSTAEEARLMTDLGRWVCSQLKHDIAMWNAHDIPPLSIAINLSNSQLDAPDLKEWLAPIADKHFLGDYQLAVEISEDALNTSSEERFLALAQLHQMGIALHLDHFGRAACCLSALHALPFSLLKLDLSLMKNMNNEIAGNSDVLLKTAIMLAHQLGMRAGAVGVETPWQAETLKSCAGDCMQGFLTSEPMNATQLIKWLETPRK